MYRSQFLSYIPTMNTWNLKLKTLVLKKMKYLGINLTKYVKDLNEDHKTLVNEIKEELNKWRDTPCLWTGRQNIVKMAILPNLSHRFSAIPITIPVSYFIDTNKLILKFIWKGKRPRGANTVLKENKIEGLILPNFKTYHNATRQCDIGKRIVN